MSIVHLERPSGRAPAEGEAWTVLKLILWSAHYLAEKGVGNARLDAEYLLADTLRTGRLELYLQHDRPLEAGELAEFKPRLLRRGGREPLQYILGHTAFRDMELRVDRRALIPRPETESLVEEVLAWASSRGGPLSALDIGTGSGAIALSLAKEGTFARVLATDTSREALDLARENHAPWADGIHVEFREGSLFDPLDHEERFDVIVSNPPYIRDGEGPGLAPEVRDWEPGTALMAGAEGLDVLGPLVDGAGAHLELGGLFALEVGDDQAEVVSRRLERSDGFGNVRTANDLTGRERFVLAERTRPSGLEGIGQERTSPRG